MEIAVRDILAIRHQEFIWAQANRSCRDYRNGACELADLVQAAWVGLLLAMERAEESSPKELASFAWQTIRGAIGAELARMRRPVCVPSSSRNKSDRYTRDIHTDAADDESLEYRRRIFSAPAASVYENPLDCAWADGLLEVLDDEERTCVCYKLGLRDHEELSHADIGMRIGRTKGQVKATIRRATRKMIAAAWPDPAPAAKATDEAG